MRIGLVQYRSPGQISGGFIYNEKLVDYCRSQGDDVEVITLDWRGWPRAIGANWSSSLRARLERGQIDVLIEDAFASLSLFALNDRLPGIRKIALLHQLNSSEALPSLVTVAARLVDRRFLRSVDGLLVNSEATLSAARKLVLKSLPLLIAYPAGDRFASLPIVDQIAARAMEPGPLRILYAGNVIRRKRLDVLVEALQKRVQTAWCLRVVGDQSPDPPYATMVRRRADLDPAGRVRFEGAVDQDCLAAIYRQSHVVAIPSRYEGFGMSYLEGMGFGLPPLAAASGGAGEFVINGVSGFLIGADAAAASQIAAAIDLLGSDRERLADMAVAARATFDGRPSWAETMARVRSFLLGFTS